MTKREIDHKKKLSPALRDSLGIFIVIIALLMLAWLFIAEGIH